MSSPLYLCVHLRDFAAQALARAHPELHSSALAVLSGDPPLERVFAMNQQACRLGLETGMSRVQAESFSAVLLGRDPQQEHAAFAELMRCAGKFSPRIEPIASPQEETCGATLLLDVSGSERLLGGPRQIATTLRQSLCALAYEASVAVSRNACAALLAARGLAGAVAIAPGCEAETLAPLPLSVLEPNDELAQTLAAWGIRTLGQLAALPARPLAARLGQSGLRLQAQARAEYRHLLVPAEEPADAPLCENIELEHPVELLEPLLFLLSRMLEQVTGRAAQRSLAIASVQLCLLLDADTRGLRPEDPRPEDPRLEDRRIIRPAIPERSHHTLLKLLQLELELHPPAAAVVALRIQAHPARPQTAQPGLFADQAPEPGRLEILLARLRKLVGEGRVGSPQLLDSHAPEAFRIENFEPGQSSFSRVDVKPSRQTPALASGTGQRTALRSLTPALRMVRPPRAVAIELRGGAPAAMHYEEARHIVQSASGPWRSNGAWWTHPAWCREEWDVALKESTQRCLRLAHDPAAGGWYVIGIYD
jgi:protein ImuB